MDSSHPDLHQFEIISNSKSAGRVIAGPKKPNINDRIFSRTISDEPKLNADFSTQCVIVGTGPAGGALASFLASNGITGIVISKTSSTAPTPRAHITNMAAMECLRDVNLEDYCRRIGNDFKTMPYTRFAHSMAGKEFARVYAWGSEPNANGLYRNASPCAPLDIPQSLLEPVLIQNAMLNGFTCRFDTEFISYHEDTQEEAVYVTVKDLLTQRNYTIRCKYLIGADGARSNVLRQLGIPLVKGEASGGSAWNVFVKADLSKYMENRRGSLHWIYQHDVDHPEFAWIGFPRVVDQWDRWLIIFFPVAGYQPEKHPLPSKEDWLKRVKQFIGDDSIPVEILDTARWQINNSVAQKYSSGRIFCLGDAVHRHPPANGLGSNTCIQDAFNLAWKIAYVLKGIAGPKLLNSYSDERQPVGAGVVERANDGVRAHLPIWQAVGILDPSVEARREALAELSQNSEQGQKRRNALQNAIEATKFEYHGLGIEMNQRYQSTAVFQGDQGLAPSSTQDPILHHQATTYPGARVPHAWLATPKTLKPISTIDLAGKGKFTLLAGIGGEAWKEAASTVSRLINVSISAYSIGFEQDYEDSLYEWANRREVGESGCVLVRPDRFVAWRSQEVTTNCEEQLLHVMKSILSIN